VTHDVLKKRFPLKETWHLAILDERMVFVGQGREPPCANDEHLTKDRAFDPVGAGQEAFQDGPIKFTQRNAVQDVNGPRQKEERLRALLARQQTLDKTYVAEPIAHQQNVALHSKTISNGRDETRDSRPPRLPFPRNKITDFHKFFLIRDFSMRGTFHSPALIIDASRKGIRGAIDQAHTFCVVSSYGAL